MNRLLPLGRCGFALAMVAFGIQHFVYGDFVTRAVPSWPAWIPRHALWAYLIGAMLVGAGGAILLLFRTRGAALLLAALLLLSFVFLGLPLAVKDMPWGGQWTNAGKALALGGGALAIALSSPGAAGESCRLPGGLIVVARLCFSAFLVLGGIQHFIWGQFVKTMVPAWIPGPLFWTYFAGVALIAGGLGIVLPRTTRWASLCTGVMIFLWVILLHIPRALADRHNSNETTAVFEALAFSGIAFVLAGMASPVRGAGTPKSARA
ncbi:MAG TPA: DoxX family membrane protein [Candidatus Limnocylindria bacterium]|nr:DoxX family membrane protein [Candidatus Limnocylindria bacterium]